jgi:hypothetical protein
MSPQPSENADLVLHLESRAVSFGYPIFPNISGVLHLLDFERRVPLAAEEELKLPLDGFLEMIGKRAIVSNETFREIQLHILVFFNAFKASWEFSKGPTTLPSVISLSASVSFSCHSLVKKYSWSG